MDLKELHLKLSKEETEKVLGNIDMLLKGGNGGIESFFNSKGRFDIEDLNTYFKDYTYKEFMSWLILNYETVKKEKLVEAVDSYADEVTLYILGELEEGKGDREYIFYFNKTMVYLQDSLIDGDYTIETPGSSFKLYISFSGGGSGTEGCSVLSFKTSFKFDLYKAAADWVEGGKRGDDGGFTINVDKEDLETVIDDIVGACITPRRSSGNKGYPVYSLVMSDSQHKDGFYKCGKELPTLKI
jgi:hypothetical protein